MGSGNYHRMYHHVGIGEENHIQGKHRNHSASNLDNCFSGECRSLPECERDFVLYD